MDGGGDALVLASGRRVALRAVRRRDLPAMNAFLMGLAPRSRRHRFHGAINALPCTALLELTSRDDHRHATLVAWADGDDAAPRLVGEARWVRDDDHPERAEFALAIADDWQRQGLARALLQRLRDSAAEQGVAWLYGSVLDDNAPMLALLARAGARAVRDHRLGHGIVWRLGTAAEPPAQALTPAHPAPRQPERNAASPAWGPLAA